ncbi:MAG: hypothetical protein ACJAZO_003507 [Myxococcota bacterium]
MRAAVEAVPVAFHDKRPTETPFLRRPVRTAQRAPAEAEALVGQADLLPSGSEAEAVTATAAVVAEVDPPPELAGVPWSLE